MVREITTMMVMIYLEPAPVSNLKLKEISEKLPLITLVCKLLKVVVFI